MIKFYNSKNSRLKTKILWLWLYWVLASALGGAVIGYLDHPTDFFWQLFMSGFIMGFAQCLVLWQLLWLDKKTVFFLFLFSGLGWILGSYINSLIPSNYNEPIIFTFFGIAQWLVLQEYLKHSWLWFLASSLAGFFYLPLGRVVCKFVCSLGHGAITNAAAWSAWAAITGTMFFLLKIKYRHPSSQS